MVQEDIFDPIILALDTSDRREVDVWLEAFPQIRRVKVGLQLFLAHGKPLVRELCERGYWVFLDLKLHDIPNTVAHAVSEVCELGVGLTTLHALGGARMIEVAVAARASAGGHTGIVAVTALTSHSELEWEALGFRRNIEQSVVDLALRSVNAGADGVVCSPQETGVLREKLGPDALLVVPGIRLPGQDTGDQSRVATPGSTLRAGAGYLVMGRSLTTATDSRAVMTELQADLDGT